MSALDRMLEAFAAQPAGARSAARAAAAKALRAAGLPTARDENWHYANLRTLEHAGNALGIAAVPAGAPRSSLSLPESPQAHHRLLLIDGRLAADTAWPTASGITRLPFEAAVAADPPTAFSTDGDGRLGLTARLFAPEPLALQLSQHAALEIISISTTDFAGCYTDIVIGVEAGAQVSLIERRMTAVADGQARADADAIDGHNLQLRIARGACVTHTRLQHTGDPVVQHDTLAVTVGEQATYRLRHMTAGGASARSSVQVRLAGRDSAFDLRAVTAAKGAQVADAQYTILHEAPGTKSDQLFRGIASDRAHVACSADVQVAGTATGARVQQSLRGLIDGKGAEVDLRPRLTIHTNEVQATHGATTGRLDETLLFYLLSRGIDEPSARSLLKWAFLGEALGAIEPPALRRAAGLAVAARLSDAPATELLQ